MKSIIKNSQLLFDSLVVDVVFESEEETDYDLHGNEIPRKVSIEKTYSFPSSKGLDAIKLQIAKDELRLEGETVEFKKVKDIEKKHLDLKDAKIAVGKLPK